MLWLKAWACSRSRVWLGAGGKAELGGEHAGGLVDLGTVEVHRLDTLAGPGGIRLGADEQDLVTRADTRKPRPPVGPIASEIGPALPVRPPRAITASPDRAPTRVR